MEVGGYRRAALLAAESAEAAAIPAHARTIAAATAAEMLTDVVRALAVDDAPTLRSLAAHVLGHAPPPMNATDATGELLHLAHWLATDDDSRVADAALACLGRWLPPPASLALTRTLLQSAWMRLRLAAVGIAAALPTAATAALLRGALHDQHWAVRQQAAQALGHMGPTGAVDEVRAALTGALEDGDEDVRQSAALALARLGELVPALAALAHDLRSDEPRVRQGAVEALARLDDRRAIDTLLPLLTSADWALRQSAAVALGRLGETAGAREVLLYDLQSDRWFVRQGAASALGRLGDGAAGTALLAALADPDWSVRQAAAEALGRLGPRDAVPPLREALHDADGDVRQSAAEALGHLGASAALLHALHDADSDVRRAVVEALGLRARAPQAEPDAPDVTAALLQRLEQDPDSEVRQAAAEVLSLPHQAADSRIVPALLGALRTDSSADVQQSAALALGRVGRADPDLFAQLAGLATVGTPDERVLACLALRPLVATNPQRAFGVATRTLRSQQLTPIQRAVCFEIIGRCALLGVSAAGAAVQQLARSSQQHERCTAAALAGELLPLQPSAFATLEDLAQDADWTVREAVACALARRSLFAAAQATHLLERLAADAEPAVIYAALAALARLTGEHGSFVRVLDQQQAAQRLVQRYSRSTQTPGRFAQVLSDLCGEHGGGFAPFGLPGYSEYGYPPTLEELLYEPGLFAPTPAPPEEVRALLRALLPCALPTPEALEGFDRLLHLLPDPLIFYVIYKQTLACPASAACRLFYELAALTEKAHAIDMLTEAEMRWLRQHLPTTLQRLATGLRVLPPSAQGAIYAHHFAILHHLLTAATLPALLPALAAAEQEHAQARATTPDDSHLGLALQALRAAVAPLRQYSAVAPHALRALPISETLAQLETVARLVHRDLTGLQRLILLQVLEAWRELLRHAIRRLEGEAHLDLTAPAEVVQANPGAPLALVLALHNRGPAPASNLRIRLHETDMARPAPAEQRLTALAPGEQHPITFTVQPAAPITRLHADWTITYDDLLQRDNEQTHTAEIVVRPIARAWRHIPNPYLPGRPYPNGRGGTNRLFVGREDILRFVAENLVEAEAERIIVLYGHRRTGKTWLLLRLQEHLPAAYLPVYIDVQELKGTNGVPALLQIVADEIVRTLQAHAAVDPATLAALRVPTREEYAENYPYYFKRIFLRAVGALLGERRLLWLVDEFQGLADMVQAGQVPAAFLEFLRNLMQFGTQLAFIFAGTRRLTDDYWSVFFNLAVHRKVGVLAERDAERLITAPLQPAGVEFDRFAVPLVRHLTGNHPYFLQLLCDRIVAALNAHQQMLVTPQIIDEAVDDLVQHSASNLQFYWTDVMTSAEQAVAATTQELRRRRLPADPGTIWQELGRANPRVTADDVTVALRGLVEKDLLAKEPAGVDAYRFKIGLVEHYIGAHILYADIQRQIARLW